MNTRRRRAPRVLIVEDYDDARQMYSKYLEHCGFAVSQARDGAEALRVAAREPPDLIVMDLALPGIDGWEATRRLKARSATRTTPVIALTGHALAGQEDVARSAGCDAFLTKPCLPDELAAAIRRTLEQRQVSLSSAPGRRTARPAAKRERRLRGSAKSV